MKFAALTDQVANFLRGISLSYKNTLFTGRVQSSQLIFFFVLKTIRPDNYVALVFNFIKLYNEMSAEVHTFHAYLNKFKNLQGQ